MDAKALAIQFLLALGFVAAVLAVVALLSWWIVLFDSFKRRRRGRGSR